MLETCKSCGTVFEVDQTILTKNIKWFKCGVCNKKWNSSPILDENPKIQLERARLVRNVEVNQEVYLRLREQQEL